MPAEMLCCSSLPCKGVGSEIVITVSDGQLVIAYIVKPGQLVGLWIGLDNALEVGVVAFLDVIRIQFGAHAQERRWRICNVSRLNIFNVTI